MKRWLLFIPITTLVLLPIFARAQEATPESTPLIPEAVTQEPGAVEPTPAAPTLPAVPDALPVLITARSDMELLANSTLGATRPDGWSGSMDFTDPNLPLLTRLDLELLVSALLGVDQRPSGWFGAVPSTPYAIARDIRHDLELLADAVVQPNVRPPGWTGGDPIMRCNRATQNLISLAERSGFRLDVNFDRADYCQLAEAQVSLFAETTLLNVVIPNVGSGGGAAAPVGSVTANGSGIAAFLDRNARQRAGVLPMGMTFAPIARSYAQFSNMMVVRGEGFEVWVDYTFTTLSADAFKSLPNVDSVEIHVSCTADWCGQ